MKAAAADQKSRRIRGEALPLDVKQVRKDFPILGRQVNGRPLIYLDNAATTQKPACVIQAGRDYYETLNANVHRGVHRLSMDATDAYEAGREAVRGFINAGRVEEIIFVRGATEGINLIASSFGRSRVGRGDDVLISAMEHHSNIVPWQILCEQAGANLRVAPIDDRGELILDAFVELLGPRTRLVAVSHMSNALGTVNPVREIVSAAHERGIPVIIDGAQAVPHLAVDVRDLGCDFYVFSGHKVYGPTGVGVVYGRYDLLEAMPPYQSGGDMIRSVTFEKTVYNDLPFKFEAGTPNIVGGIGLAAAIGYVERVGLDRIAAHEADLLAYATAALEAIPEVRLIGTAREKASVLSFVIEGIHPHDVGTILDKDGVAIRTGHHCAQPLMQRFKVPATARASFGMYNTRDEVDALAAGIRGTLEVFS